MKRILIIDDEPLLREVLSEALAGEGLEVAFAADGEAGIRRALAEPPDAVVVDLCLPKKNGFQVIEALRSDPSTRAVVILVTSAKSFPPDRRKALELGANEFLLKPYDLGALRSALAAGF